MIRTAAALVLAAGLSTAVFAAAPGATSSHSNRAALKAAQVEAKSGATAKLGPVLRALYKAQGTASSSLSARSLATNQKLNRLQNVLGVKDGTVRIDVALSGDGASSRAAFEAMGLTNVSTYENHISGRLPISALASVSRNSSVIAVHPSLSRTRAGLTQTQGDVAQRTDEVRHNFGLTGAGVKVGVLSDSFNCRKTPLTPDPLANFTTGEQDVVNGDLSPVQVLKDLPEPDCSDLGTDEGRAILQLVHDVAPASKLAFYTANVSDADFAAGIKALANAGSNVIVDDVIYFAEPMFQDGIIAQAVDYVKSKGVTYFSSSGNEERQSYEAAFKHSGVVGASGEQHNFGTRKAPDTLQQATVDPGALSLLVFQWDQPFASVSAGGRGSASDVDVIFYDTNGDPIAPCNDNLEPAVCQFPGIDANEGGDPLEEAVISNSSDSSVDVNIGIELFDGPAPNRMKYVWFDLGAGIFHLDEFVTDSSSNYGHPNAAGAEAVGAAPWYNTAEWGSPLWGAQCRPACLEYFSGAGGTPILFDTKGRRLPFPEVRLKPGVTGPDGGNTSFFFSRTTDPRVGGGEPDVYPNFFGTSASAPHVAAIAALMLEQMKKNGPGHFIQLPAKLVPDFIFTTLRATAGDIKWRAARTIAPYPIEHPNGFDFDSGFGYVDAVKALTVVKTLRVSTSN